MKKPFFALWILTLALFIFSWIYLPGISKYRDLKIKQEEIEEDLRLMEEKVKAIREERDLLKNDVQYLEKVIRDELGLVKPGEVVYKFVPEPPKKETPAPLPVPASVTPSAVELPAKPKAPPMATAGNPLKQNPSVLNAVAQAINAAGESKKKSEPVDAQKNSVPEALPTPIQNTAPALDQASRTEIRVSQPAQTDEPVYPRQEIR